MVLVNDIIYLFGGRTKQDVGSPFSIFLFFSLFFYFLNRVGMDDLYKYYISTSKWEKVEHSDQVLFLFL